MDKVEIYYFSGTGNSLYVARELQKRIPGTKLTPIVSLLNKGVIDTSAETVGFVFPIHFTAIPTFIKGFIKKLDLKSSKYIFAIATRVGITHSAFYDIDKTLKKKGKKLDAYFSLNMAGNDPKFEYKVPTEEELLKLHSEVLNRLDLIEKVIINKEKNWEKDNHATITIPSILMRLIPAFLAISERLGFQENFYSDFNCSGCGTCEKVCLSKKIKMVNNKPVWQKSVKCYHCSACLNYCPMQSVQIKSHTEKNGRYPHPYATVEDIVGQK